MNAKTIQYGPFSPQELESIVREMQLKNIPFEIAKDEAEEGKFKRIDYANLISQTQFRTKQYIAQIFYITLAKSDLGKLSGSLERLGFPTESSENPPELAYLPEEDIFMKAKTEKKNFNRRMIAWLLALGLLCQIILVLIFYVL